MHSDVELDSGSRVVLITGAAGGIGAATARALAREGACLALHARTVDARARLDQLAADCRELGSGPIASVFGDLGEPETAQRIVDASRHALGRLDQVVCNAGYARMGPVLELPWARLLAAFAAMPASFASMVQAAVPVLADSPLAAIVAVSSFVAHRFDAAAPFAETAAAKAALEALARCAAIELAPRAITVNVVVPGFTRREGPVDPANQAAWERAHAATPSGRVGHPDEIADAILFLLSARARQITGTLIHVDGGLTAR